MGEESEDGKGCRGVGMEQRLQERVRVEPVGSRQGTEAIGGQRLQGKQAAETQALLEGLAAGGTRGAEIRQVVGAACLLLLSLFQWWRDEFTMAPQ